jgi:hypothetical protein
VGHFFSGKEMKKEHKQDQKFHRLLFYEKPLVGSVANRQTTSSLPLQIFSYGNNGQQQQGYQIALPLQQNRIENYDSLYIRGDAMVISGPESTIEDNRIRKSLVNMFLLIAIVNLIITFCLFFDAHIADISNVIPSSIAPNTFSFVQVPRDRRYSENLIFSFTIFNLIFGIIGAILQSPLVLFLYSLVALLIFFVGFPVVPTLLYTTRYLLDAVNLYVAFVLRSKLMINILPFYFVRR